MPWFNLLAIYLDGATTPPLKSTINVGGEDLFLLIRDMVAMLLKVQEAATEMPPCDLGSMVQVQIELTSWISSKSCESPGPR